MKDDNIFDKMKNAFTPVTTGTDGDGAEGLPLGMVQRGERMVYGYAFTVAQKLTPLCARTAPMRGGIR